MHNSIGLPFDNSLHGSIHRPRKYTTINFGYMRMDSTIYLLGMVVQGYIVQSERMINVHMICTQKQMKDIRGMRVQIKIEMTIALTIDTPQISTDYLLLKSLLILLLLSEVLLCNCSIYCFICVAKFLISFQGLLLDSGWALS